MERRNFIKYGALLATSSPLNIIKGVSTFSDKKSVGTKMATQPICVFIKPIEKYGYENIATILSESGFDGADISFRKGGLIIPETAKRELPKLVKILSRKNISIPMAVSGITNPNDPETENQIKLMTDFGIKYYRLGMIHYNSKLSLKDNMELLKRNLNKLCELNIRYGIHGAIQNHVGDAFGSPIWDAYIILKECDPDYLGFQYDIRHAVAEGNGSWSLGMEIISDYIRTTCIKDFTWVQDNKKFKPVSVPLGEGIVDFKKYFELLKKGNISGPVSIHYEYPLYSDIETNTTEQIKMIISKMRQDLDIYKKLQSIYFK